MIEFVNAQEKALENLETFDAPVKEELDALTPDTHVKVCTGGERFWVKLTAVDGDKLKGWVDNDLINTHTHGLDYGDEVEFGKEHVYDILPPDIKIGG